MPTKIKIFEIVKSSILEYWLDRRSSLILPLYLALILTLIKFLLFKGAEYFLNIDFTKSNPLFILLIMVFCEVILFTSYSVLMVRRDKFEIFRFKEREGRYLLIGLELMLLSILPLVLISLITDSVLISFSAGILWNLFVMSRILLIMPAAAMDDKELNINASWELTKDNWVEIFISSSILKLFIILCLVVPYLGISMGIRLLSLGAYGIFVDWLLIYFIMFAGIGILSIYLNKIYRFLKRY